MESPYQSPNESSPISLSAKGLRLRADALLMLGALIWGSAFVPQRIAAEHLGPFLFNGLRFLLGAAILLPWLLPLPARCS
jgi:drug/metabolite transporter (DMT)-like permease